MVSFTITPSDPWKFHAFISVMLGSVKSKVQVPTLCFSNNSSYLQDGEGRRVKKIWANSNMPFCFN